MQHENILKTFFSNALNQVLKGHVYTKDPRKGKYRASGIVSDCERSIVFDNTLNWESSEYVELCASGGNLIHSVIQSLLMQTGNFDDGNIEVESNLTIQNSNITFTGHTDLLIVTLKGITYIIDIKTTQSLFYNGSVSTFLPKQSHINQVTIYMTSYINSHDIDISKVRGVLWYIERTNNNPELFKIVNPNYWYFHTFEYSKDIFSKLFIKAINLTNKLNSGKLPDIKQLPFWKCETRNRGDDTIKFRCPYFNLCHNPETKINTLNDLILTMEEK